MKARHHSSYLVGYCFLWPLKASNLASSNQVHPPCTLLPYLATIKLAKTAGITVQPPIQINSHLLNLVQLALYSVYHLLIQMPLTYLAFSLFKIDADL